MRCVTLAILVAVLTAPIAAQGPAPAGLRSIAHSQVPSSTRNRTSNDSLPRTHWDLGMEIGAGIGFVGGLGLQSFINGMCEGPDCHGFQPLAFVLPMAIFAIVGGLIGSAFPKS